MELRSRKLPSPFQPVREDHEDQERVMLPRSFSPDVHCHQPHPEEFALHAYGEPAISGTSHPSCHQPELDPEDCYIPPSGTPSQNRDNNPVRCQQDPDFEDIFFSPRGKLATGVNEETNRGKPDPDPDDLRFHTAKGRAHNPHQLDPDCYLSGSTPADGRANQPYGRQPTPVPMHQPGNISPVPEKPENPVSSYKILPVHNPMAVFPDTAASAQPQCQDPHAPCMSGPSPYIQPTQRPNTWSFPRSHRVEPNYIEPNQELGSQHESTTTKTCIDNL